MEPSSNSSYLASSTAICLHDCAVPSSGAGLGAELSLVWELNLISELIKQPADMVLRIERS